MTVLAIAASTISIMAAAFVKGAVGFGFPLLATPLLALFIDFKSAVAGPHPCRMS